MKYSIGTKVRCISDTFKDIKPGTILEIGGSFIGDEQRVYAFLNTKFRLYEHEIEPLNRTIRDVKEGDVVNYQHNEAMVLAVGENGFSRTYWGDGIDNKSDGCWIAWKEAESYDYTIKQPEQEKQEIKISAEVIKISDLMQKEYIKENRNLIIELQKAVNKIIKE